MPTHQLWNRLFSHHCQVLSRDVVWLAWRTANCWLLPTRSWRFYCSTKMNQGDNMLVVNLNFLFGSLMVCKNVVRSTANKYIFIWVIAVYNLQKHPYLGDWDLIIWLDVLLGLSVRTNKWRCSKQSATNHSWQTFKLSTLITTKHWLERPIKWVTIPVTNWKETSLWLAAELLRDMHVRSAEHSPFGGLLSWTTAQHRLRTFPLW